MTAHAGSTGGSATVLVRPARRPRQSDDQWRADQETLPASTTLGSEELLSSLLDRFVPAARAQGGGGGDIGLSAAVGAVGNPLYGVIESTRLGAVLPQTNFNMGIPLISLGGRGLSANLSLYYNSNVWGARYDSSGTMYTFDPIESWPSPGFTLGLGRIAYYDWQYDPIYAGSYALMLIDPDGTRHSLGRVAQSTATTVTTSDGTHITYVGSVTGGGTLCFQNGTKKTIVHEADREFSPVLIVERPPAQHAANIGDVSPIGCLQRIGVALMPSAQVVPRPVWIDYHECVRGIALPVVISNPPEP